MVQLRALCSPGAVMIWVGCFQEEALAVQKNSMLEVTVSVILWRGDPHLMFVTSALFALHAPERFVFATYVSKLFSFAEMCGSLLCGCFLGWDGSPYRIAERLPSRKQHVRACRCFFLFLGFDSVVYRILPRALVKFLMHTLSKESSKHSLNC